MREKRMGTWDKGFEDDEVELILKEKLREALKYYNNPDSYPFDLPEPLLKHKMRSRVVNLAVLLIQLKNASRISEACEGLIKWIESGKEFVYVRVRKRQDQEKRLITIPEEVLKLKEIIEEYLKEEINLKPEKLAGRVKKWSQVFIGINTHSLRYAKITNLLEKYNPIMVAKITMHKRVDTLVEYAQEKKAEEILIKEVYKS